MILTFWNTDAYNFEWNLRQMLVAQDRGKCFAPAYLSICLDGHAVHADGARVTDNDKFAYSDAGTIYTVALRRVEWVEAFFAE